MASADVEFKLFKLQLLEAISGTKNIEEANSCLTRFAAQATMRQKEAKKQAAVSASTVKETEAGDFNTGNDELDKALQIFRSDLAKSGARSIMGLSRKFKILDEQGNGRLTFPEFRRAIQGHSDDLTINQLKTIFEHFDDDSDGTINFNEFLLLARGSMNARRRALVEEAFRVFDLDGNGIVDQRDLVNRYNCDRHPDVMDGKKTEGEVFNEFLHIFHAGKDGLLHLDDFIEYYDNVSASVDNDDNFELIIRNVWHLSGGEGWSANTTCKRVLVTHTDGSETVEEIRNDFDLNVSDPEAIKMHLRNQGVDDVASISMSGVTDNISPPVDVSTRPSNATTDSRAVSSDNFLAAAAAEAPRQAPKPSPAPAPRDTGRATVSPRYRTSGGGVSSIVFG